MPHNKTTLTRVRPSNPPCTSFLPLSNAGAAMSANAGILVEQLKKVLIASIQVVANREGKKVCYVAIPQGPKQRQVQTGPLIDTKVHIISGLEAGV